MPKNGKNRLFLVVFFETLLTLTSPFINFWKLFSPPSLFWPPCYSDNKSKGFKQLWTNLPPWPYTFCAGTKSTRSRHEKSWAVTKFFMDSSLLYFHSGLKYLVPAQAIIIGFRTVLVPSQAIPSRPLPCFVPTWAVLCRYRPASSLSYFLSVSVPARNRHEIDTKSPESTRVMPSWKMTRKSVATVENYFTYIQVSVAAPLSAVSFTFAFPLIGRWYAVPYGRNLFEVFTNIQFSFIVSQSPLFNRVLDIPVSVARLIFFPGLFLANPVTLTLAAMDFELKCPTTTLPELSSESDS